MWPSGSRAICSDGWPGALAIDTPLVRLDPDDRPVRLGDDAVRVGARDLLEELARPVRLQDEDAAGLAIVGQVVRRVGEVQPPVRSEGQVVGRLERDAADLGDDLLDPPVRPRLLDRRPAHHLGPPRADGAAVLGDVERPVAAEHAGVGPATAVGVVVDARAPRDQATILLV